MIYRIMEQIIRFATTAAAATTTTIDEWKKKHDRDVSQS